VGNRALLSVLLSIGALACGDGIGQPIVAGAETAGSSGLGGTAGQSGTAGNAGVTAGSGGSTTQGGAGSTSVESGGSTTAGTAGSASGGPAQTGGAAGGGEDGPPGFAGYGMGAGPPWQEDPPDREDWRDEDPLEAVPPSAQCESVVDWDEASAEAERELFRFLTFARESGFACAGEAAERLPPLFMSPELRCAARLHSRDMIERAFFDHVNPDGVGPEDRMRRAGASFAVASESIARNVEMIDVDVPYQAVAELFAEDESACKNLADPRFEAVGIGMFEGHWTLDFTGR
jgi:hypothetical protein